MWAWIKGHFCFHKWEHIETHAIQLVKTEPTHFMSSYRCTKCGKVKSTYTYT